MSEWSVRCLPVCADTALKPPRGSIIVASGDRASYCALGWQKVLGGLTQGFLLHSYLNKIAPKNTKDIRTKLFRAAPYIYINL